MIIGIHGYLGSMKTVTGVTMAALAEEEGYTIMSNQPLNYGICRECNMIFKEEEDYQLHIPIHNNVWVFFKKWIRLDMDMIRRYAIIAEPLPYDKLFILGDEWQQVMDARRSMDGDELINTYFIMQTRKRYVKLAYITSLRGMNDLRLRDNTNIIFKCYKKHKEGGKICYDDECERPHFADWYIINVQAGKGKHVRFANPEIVYPMFDTRHIISPISHLNEAEMQEIIKAIRSGIS